MLFRMRAWRRCLGVGEGVFEVSSFEGVEERRAVELRLDVPVTHVTHME